MGTLNKKELVKADVRSKHGCFGVCSQCTNVSKLIDHMYDANIPVGYWMLKMKDFCGSKDLKELYDDYNKDIKKKYFEGKSICLSGGQGIGKTMVAISIMKVALKKDLSAYYITALDMLNLLTDYKNSAETKKIFQESDFLVIDELDSRFFISDSVKELFSGIYENIFRYRTHNMLPTIICTNEISGILNVFHGQSKQAITSLNKQYLTTYHIAGKDVRSSLDRK